MVRFSSKDLTPELLKRIQEADKNYGKVPQSKVEDKPAENGPSHFLAIKPMSVNEIFKGRRFKTKEYSRYRSQLSLILPKIEVPEKGKLKLCIEFGFSNSGADIDNSVKGFTDALSETYGFNDNRIYRLEVEKVIVKKGEEYIKFDLVPYSVLREMIRNLF